MNDGDGNQRPPMPLQLSRLQQDVIQALRSRQNEKYPLSEWYLGAIYALDNHYNPDRFSQAAHSLRELLEKLARPVSGSDVQIVHHNFQEARRDIAERIAEDRQRYSAGWEGRSIDRALAETIEKAATYFERSQQPSRRDQVQMAIERIDPLANQFDAETLTSKRDRLFSVWKQLEKYAHHSSASNGGEFAECLELLERTILDLLAPITAQDQEAIRSILERVDRTDADIEQVFILMNRRGANYTFFFDQATDPSWIPLLREKGYLTAHRELNEKLMARILPLIGGHWAICHE